MTTEFYKIGSGCDADVLERAGELIRCGELVAFPTETVYGLGANAYLAESARKVYAAKGRPSDNPLIVHVNDSADASLFAETNETYEKLAKRFMPGPLTVILPKKDVIPDEVTGGLRTVAVRCPSNPIARELIRRSGVPIAAPSANLSGKPSPTCAEHVMQDMDGRIAMVIDGGECEIGLESTVIAVSGNSANVLRPGAVTPDMLRSAGIAVTVDEAVTDPAKAGSAPQSPGMKYKHYAPSLSPPRVRAEAFPRRRRSCAPMTILRNSPDLSYSTPEKATRNMRTVCFPSSAVRTSSARKGYTPLYRVPTATLLQYSTASYVRPPEK